MDYGNYLDFNFLPRYHTSSHRAFYPGERHVTRVCREDVLVCMLAGTLRFDEDGSPIELHPGQFYIQKSGLTQAGRIPSDAPRYFYMHFTGRFCSGPEGLPLSGHFSPEKLEPFFLKLEALENRQGTSLEKSAAFYAILCALSSGQDNTAVGPAEQAAEFLAKNYASPVVLADLERETNYSGDYLIRVFKRRFGVTPYRYLTELRMRQVRELLLSTSRPVAQIAAECGYRDLSAFYRAFSKANGCAPGEFKGKG